MPEYQEVERRIEVPKGTGIDGFLKTIERILRQPRVQSIQINARGDVTYRRYVRDGEPNEELRIDFETLMPWAVIRNSDVKEMAVISLSNAATSISHMFQYVSSDHLNPIAFAIHPKSLLWEWHAKTTNVVLNHDQIYGLPVMLDEQIPEEALVLCAGYGRDARLIDTVRAYKLTMNRGDK